MECFLMKQDQNKKFDNGYVGFHPEYTGRQLRRNTQKHEGFSILKEIQSL